MLQLLWLFSPLHLLQQLYRHICTINFMIENYVTETNSYNTTTNNS